MSTSMVERRNSPTKKSSGKSNIGGALRTILKCYELFGFDSTGYSLKNSITYWENLAKECDWMSLTKYKIAAFFSHHIGNPLPKAPFSGRDLPGVLLGGKAYRWLRSTSSPLNDKTKRYEFLTTILYSKKGMPRPDSSFLKEAELEMFNMLTTVNPTPFNTVSQWPENRRPFRFENYVIQYTASDVKRDWGEIDDNDSERSVGDAFSLSHPLVLQRRHLKNEVERTVDELFPPGKLFPQNEFFKPRFPSTSANYINSRGKGGAVNEVLEVRDELLGPPKKLPPNGADDELFDYDEDYDVTLIQEKLVKVPAEVCYKYTPGGDESQNERIIEEEGYNILLNGNTIVECDVSALVSRAERLYQEVYKRAATDPPIAVPVALAESLKVRVISKGPPLLYTTLKPLQQYLHTELRQHPCFRLIGETISEGYILERMGAKLEDDEVYLSGDYKSSTDYIDPLMSTWVVDRLSDNLGLLPVQREMFHRALTGHYIRNPVTGELKKQQWGQLMGSIVSFPVLCIINAALCRFSLEYAYKRHYTLNDARLAINGDDVLMRTKLKTGEQAFTHITSCGGLIPSVGKCYTSREYMNMNSTSYLRGDLHEVKVRHRDGNGFVTRQSPFHHIPYVNLGLMFGMKRSQGGVSVIQQNDENSIGSRATELIKSCPERLRPVVYKAFLNRHWNKLKQVHVPWYMPEWIGGLGLPTLFDPDFIKSDDAIDSEPKYLFGPTDLDRRKAVDILLNFKKYSPKVGVPPHSWNVHKWIMGRLPHKPFKAPVSEVDSSQYDRLYGLLAVEALLRCQLSDLYDDDPASSGKNVLRHNERVWSKAKPMSIHKLKWHEKSTQPHCNFLPISLVY